MDQMQTLRAQINEVDRQLVQLYEQRMAICREIGLYKKEQGLPVLDPEREQAVLASKCALVQDPALKPQVAALFEQIMAQSRMLQNKLGVPWSAEKEASYREFQQALTAHTGAVAHPRIAYQGQPGAYAEEAAIAFFGESCSRTCVKSWEDIILAICEGRIDYGVLPIENSSTGSINAVYDLLGQYGCYVVGEQIVRVSHALVAPRGACLADIRQVHSHEQGLLQCASFLKLHPQWEQVAQANTAVAAKLVSESHDRTQAAIASARTAKLYGLDILAEKINANDNNYTRFVIVAATPQISGKSDKVSVVFTLPHVEGSLHRILAIFAAGGCNLLKLESRPIVGKNWEYTFFADFTGNLRGAGMDEIVRQLIDETLSWRILGNYQAAHL